MQTYEIFFSYEFAMFSMEVHVYQSENHKVCDIGERMATALGASYMYSTYKGEHV